MFRALIFRKELFGAMRFYFQLLGIVIECQKLLGLDITLCVIAKVRIAVITPPSIDTNRIKSQDKLPQNIIAFE